MHVWRRLSHARCACVFAVAFLDEPRIRALGTREADFPLLDGTMDTSQRRARNPGDIICFPLTPDVGRSSK